MRNCVTCGREIEDKYIICFNCFKKKSGRFKCQNCGKRLFNPYILCYDCNIKHKELKEKRICISCELKKALIGYLCEKCYKEDDIKNWARWKTYSEWGSAIEHRCIECNSQGDCEWHHEDYNEPLNPKKTYPLCRLCHNKKRIKN